MHYHHRDPMTGPTEVIVKIDDGDDSDAAATPNGNTTICRDSSLDFWRQDANGAMHQAENDYDDPPSMLIGKFLRKQKAAGGETTVDVDLEMDELCHDGTHNSRPHNLGIPSSRGSNVVDIGPDVQEKSWQSNAASSSSSSSSSSFGEDDQNRVVLNRRRSSNMVSNVDVHGNGGGNEGLVLRCTTIQRRVSGLGRIKTRSRLMDPPEVTDRRSEAIKSGQLRSGMLQMTVDEEEEDPLFDEDLPDDYKKAKYDVLTIAQMIGLVLITTSLTCSLAISGWKRKKFRGLSLWKWEVLVLVLICGRLVSGWAIRIVVFFIERNFFMRKRVLYFVYGIRKAVQNCIWLGLVLVAWHCMFDRKVQGNNRFLWYVNKVMVCMLVGTLLWLAKTLMVKVLASSFHVSTFFDRIQESLFNQYVIETLSGPPLIEIRNHQEQEDRTMDEVWRLQNGGAALPPELRAPEMKPAKSGKVGGNPGAGLPPRPTKSLKISEQLPRSHQDDQGISIDQLHKLNHKNVSAWSMKRLIKIVKNGLLTTLDEKVLDSSQGDESATQIRSEHEAISAARKIFRNVAKPKAKFINLEDLMRFLREDEALKTLNLVEGSTESQKISKASLKNWVVNSFVERRALALTLNDTKTAVNNLHRIVNVIVGVVIAVICLIILGIATGKFLLYISSQIVVVTFIFGNTCKTIFEAVVFVFVMHPFDVGDRCEVDGVQMIVEEMNILTTVFLRFDNQKIIYPNATLATRPINNYYRSPDMGDSVDFAVHIATPAEKIALIKQRITSYIENRSDHWYPSPSVVLMDLEGLNAMKMSVWLRHRMNHQNMGERFKRRALLVEELAKILKELDIEYRLYPVDVNIRAMPPLNTSRIPSSWTPPPRT